MAAALVLVEIDLTRGTVKMIRIPPETVRDYLGGSGVAAWLLHERLQPNIAPLDPESPLIFVRGLFTGLPIPAACKMSVCARSPLTGVWNEATVGGKVPAKLRSTGFAGLVVVGRASAPSYVVVTENGADIRPAGELWGRDTYDTAGLLQAELGRETGVLCIGQAGERMVKLSSVMAGGHEARAAARGGLGAVMGSKNLKAVAFVPGNAGRAVADERGLRESVRSLVGRIQANCSYMSQFGTAGSMPAIEAAGDLPVKNWQLGRFEEGARLTCGQAMVGAFLAKHYACFACPIRCGKMLRVARGPHAGETGHGPEYESAASFGSMVLNTDPGIIAAANDLCNRHGLDTISTGSAVAFAMEACERGLLGPGDAGGLSLEWGDPDTILGIVEQIASRQHLGALLAEGTRHAARQIGGIAPEFAIQTKGLEIPYHDPRAFAGMAVGYATCNRGACHMEALSYYVEGRTFPGSKIGLADDWDPHGEEGKAEVAARMQDLANVYNALGLCKFLLRGHIGPDELASWIRLVTGWDFDQSLVMRTGERLHNLKRLYNVKLGISRKDDTIPARLLQLDRKEGASAGSLPSLGRMLAEYYRIRGWDEFGIPTRAAEMTSRTADTTSPTLIP